MHFRCHLNKNFHAIASSLSFFTVVILNQACVHKSVTSYALPPEMEGFDRAHTKTSKIMGIDEDVSPSGQIEKVCWHYPDITIAETRRPSIKGAQELEIFLPPTSKEHACSSSQYRHRVFVPAEESHYKGKIGPFLFLESADAVGQTTVFSIYYVDRLFSESTLRIKNVFTGMRVFSNAFKLTRVGPNVEIDFWLVWPSPLSGDCFDEMKTDERCWARYVRDQGVDGTAVHVQMCSAGNTNSGALSYHVGVPAKLFLGKNGTTNLSIGEKAVCLQIP